MTKDYECCATCHAVVLDGGFFCTQCGASLTGDPRIGTRLLGRYRLVEKLGEGGMGAVYRAEQRVRGLVRTVAVKILHPELGASPSLRARFLRECEVVVSLTHPSTIRFFDFAELEDGALAIVMEHVDGETLAARLTRGPLPVEEALAVAAESAGSLEEAHARGIIHRDLKPENVMLYRAPGSRLGVKVLDFGVAKRSVPGERPLTARGELLGTPSHMSPEQIIGDPLDARSDVYALGLLVFEMLTGRSPFEPAGSLAEWIERHLHEPPRSIDRYPVAGVLPRAAREALMSALAKFPDERPPTARALIEALRRRPTTEAPHGASLRDTEPDDLRPSLMDDAPLVVPRSSRPLAVFALAAAVLLGFFAASGAFVLAGEAAMTAAPPAKSAPARAPAELAATSCAEDAATGC